MLLPVSCGLSMSYPAETEGVTTPASSPQGAAQTPAAAGEALTWSELTRLAREDRQAGRLDEARTRLEQAASQLAERPSSDAGRRTVFDLQARLALDLIAVGRPDDADAMAAPLFAQAEQDPALASSALVDLAYATAIRPPTTSESEEAQPARLELMELALGAAERGPASRQRMMMAADIALEALEQGHLELARRGIDRAVLDARIVAPTDQTQLGSLKIYKARIARAQGDLDAAEASAVSAAQHFEQGRSGPANLAVAEATLARVLADRGEIERAREQADSAWQRVSGDPPMPDFVKRIALGAQARVERAAGNLEAARARYEQALAMPAGGFARDLALISELQAELAALDASAIDDASAGSDAQGPGPSVDSGGAHGPSAPDADTATARETAP
jgi:hypothetical protein